MTSVVRAGAPPTIWSWAPLWYTRLLLARVPQRIGVVVPVDLDCHIIHPSSLKNSELV